ncbi:GMC oxidoreductase [Mycolicibacterium tokaiense]|uniref:Glucose-methanol-choline oxidoreductase n=1 Tax=Mycolicibacterium tokaiense TaxID=39695 RepID=A0A378TNN4_9MYCO|nr:GMC family oxidoreductase [Mycolicibacterium tokaiense]BBY89208.1 dehydrogenase [Mycolicibacterium tokaiense]STZ62402.1 glucose-methanol-choline oxidoreductase [Mycolicibacterium tokaiense]
MADGEARAHDDARRIEWDVIVVGTGMGGSALGHQLARRGKKVLFVEKGRSALPGSPGTIRARIPEVAEPAAARSAQAYLEALARGGRCTDEVQDISGRFAKTFVPFIGSGTGGSTALYGMVCERFFARDFTPRQNFDDAGASTVPEAWPVSYDEMAPWYSAAEKLLRVRGQRDPLRPEIAGLDLPAAPAFSADNQPLVDHLTERGLHPYHLPMACDYTPDCATCQTYLCDRACKNDAGRIFLEPAMAEHGARVLTECRVVGLEADGRRVRRLVCETRFGRLELTATVVVLAAGALATPALLLNSRSGDWPNGLANGSDWVGRNLMRHLLDPIEVWPSPDRVITAANKEIGLNDLYFTDGQKLGTVQSFGALPPMEWLTNRPGWQGRALRSLSPAVRRVYDRVFTGGLVLAAMMEDLPYLDNRVLAPEASGVDGRQRMRIRYHLHSNDIERHRLFLRRFKDMLRPFRTLRLGTGKDNSNLGHVCGTCRFGSDPKTSVLDPFNRTHELDNLYVVDSSFFPSSAGLNPSLTVAANALRVADHVNEAFFPT